MGFLRFLLAISVVIAHSETVFGYEIVGGRIAVQAFYIISGFYMTLILREKYIGNNNSYMLYLSNRLLRLYPIYWVVFALTILASGFAFLYTDGSNIGKLEDFMSYSPKMNFVSIVFLIFTNITIFFQDLVMFMGLDLSNGSLFFTPDYYQTNPKLYWFLMVPQAWSISIEIMFYIIAPIVVRRKWYIVVFIILLSFLLRQILYGKGLTNDPWTYRFFPTELMFFLLGTIGYEIYKKIQYNQFKSWVLKFIFSCNLSFTLFFSFINFQYKLTLYLFIFFISIPFIFLLSKNWKIDRYIGELSYPIYVVHILVVMMVTFLDLDVLNSKGLVVILISIACAILLNEFIAKKIEVYRQNRIKQTN